MEMKKRRKVKGKELKILEITTQNINSLTDLFAWLALNSRAKSKPKGLIAH